MSIYSEQQNQTSGEPAQSHADAEYATGITVLSACDVIALGRDRFVDDYIRKARPAIVRGGMKLLGRAGTWNMDYFKSVYGHLPIGVVEAENGHAARYAIDNKPRFIPFGELARLMECWSPKAERNYISFTAVDLSGFPHLSAHTLHDEMEVDGFLIERRVTRSTLRFGTGDTDSALHIDSFANLSAQIVGRKRWTIYDPSQNGHLAYMDGTDYRSAIDIDNPDYERFPKFRSARPNAEFILGPGDILFLPPFWWHRVVGLSPSVSLRVEVRAFLRQWFNSKTARAAIARSIRRRIGL
jgi:hypothetical protein